MALSILCFQKPSQSDPDTPEKEWRISATEIKQTVTAAAATMLADESAASLALYGLGQRQPLSEVSATRRRRAIGR